MKIKGIKRGQTIELLEEINLPDNSEIIMEIKADQLNSEESKRKRLQELLTQWENTDEFVQILTELHQEIHADYKEKENQKKIIEVAISGEEVVITNNGQSVVKLITKSPVKHRRQAGSAKGLVTISDDFDEPLEDFKDYM